MTLPKLYPILDTAILAARGCTPLIAAAAFIEGGAGILQLRHKGHWSRDLYAEARELAKLCREEGVLLIIDDRADMAALLGAGLHVGQDDLSPRDARKIVGDDAIVGFSSHNPSQLCAAGGEPIDYAALGPIFATASKQNPDPVVGVQQLRNCRSLIDKPLVAIGGITLENARGVLDAGADSVAVIAGLLPDQCSARTLRERIEEWQRQLRA